MTLGPTTAFPYSGDDSNPLRIAGYNMPGKWTLLEAKKKFGWQIQKGYATSGAVVYPIGDDLVVAKFRGEFWDDGDFSLYKLIRTRLLDKGVITIGGLPTASAMGISHPELKAMGVESVVVLELGAATMADGGLWVVSMDLLQYRKPIPAPPKPARTTPDVPSPIPTALNARQVEIQKLTAQMSARLGKP